MSGRKEFWNIVREVMIDNYDLLFTERLRQGYYIVREKLDELRKKGKVRQEDFEYFADAKSGAYNSYTQDVWTQLERKGYQRPEAKPVGNIWTRYGNKYPIEDFDMVWHQARGFIFTEKGGEKLEELTNYGWMIIEPEKGFPTRLIREQCRNDGRPVLAIHDADRSGEEIAISLGEKTRRTTHLDINISDVTNIGLRWEDVIKLNLPTQLEVKKHRSKRNERCELESLAVLKSRHGIENPFLEYVIMRMLQEKIPVCPTSVSKSDLMRREIVSEITDRIQSLIRPSVTNFVSSYDFGDSDTAVDVEIASASIHLENLDQIIQGVASKMAETAEWKYEDDFQREARDEVSDKLRELMG